ncbi:MAG TPA: lysozyme inhibitor LprI family protein [Rhizomicrobium sp.]
MTRIFMLAFAAIAFAATAARADECSKARTQAEMNICAGHELDQANATINNLYKETMAKYDPAGQELLRKSERAWIAFRDAECDFRTSGSKGGSIWSMVHAQCLTELTRMRIKQLEQAANCQAGDLSCRQNSDSGAD